jgi:acetyl-CoA C-acetyltransferase
MPHVASIGTYLPCRGTPLTRVTAADKPRSPLSWKTRSIASRVGICGVGIGLGSMMHQHQPHLSHVDVAKVHDFYTGTQLISYEDHGFAERFGGHKLVEADVTTIGGGLPVNPGGGLNAKAVEQVDGARIGLAHNIGGPTAVSAVTILEGTAHGAR